MLALLVRALKPTGNLLGLAGPQSHQRPLPHPGIEGRQDQGAKPGVGCLEELTAFLRRRDPEWNPGDLGPINLLTRVLVLELPTGDGEGIEVAEQGEVVADGLRPLPCPGQGRLPQIEQIGGDGLEIVRPLVFEEMGPPVQAGQIESQPPLPRLGLLIPGACPVPAARRAGRVFWRGQRFCSIFPPLVREAIPITSATGTSVGNEGHRFSGGGGGCLSR